MKRIFAILLCVVFMCSLSSGAFAAGGSVRGQSVSAAPGQTVELPVTVAENPGFSYMKLTFGFDADALELIKIENGTVSTDAFTVTEKSVSWDTGEDAKADGVLCTFTFRVKPGAAAGNYTLTLKSAGCYNINEQNVDLTLQNGSVTVSAQSAYRPGDVDNDGNVTASDARLALRRAVDLEDFAAGSAPFLACDVDHDGKVTASDARSILRAAVALEELK